MTGRVAEVYWRSDAGAQAGERMSIAGPIAGGRAPATREFRVAGGEIRGHQMEGLNQAALLLSRPFDLHT